MNCISLPAQDSGSWTHRPDCLVITACAQNVKGSQEIFIELESKPN